MAGVRVCSWYVCASLLGSVLISNGFEDFNKMFISQRFLFVQTKCAYTSKRDMILTGSVKLLVPQYPNCLTPFKLLFLSNFDVRIQNGFCIPIESLCHPNHDLIWRNAEKINTWFTGGDLLYKMNLSMTQCIQAIFSGNFVFYQKFVHFELLRLFRCRLQKMLLFIEK